MCLLSYIIHLMALYVFIHSELQELYAYIFSIAGKLMKTVGILIHVTFFEGHLNYL